MAATIAAAAQTAATAFQDDASSIDIPPAGWKLLKNEAVIKVAGEETAVSIRPDVVTQIRTGAKVSTTLLTTTTTTTVTTTTTAHVTEEHGTEHATSVELATAFAEARASRVSMSTNRSLVLEYLLCCVCKRIIYMLVANYLAK